MVINIHMILYIDNDRHVYIYIYVILPQHPAGHEPFHHLAIWPNPPGTFYRVASHGAISVRSWRPGGLAALFRRTAWCATNNIGSGA